MLRLPIHRIIPFSNVEGIGNRTSIFVQGCNLNCVYCHNSETIPKISDNTFYLTVEELVDRIKDNMPFIRGITVSGGEPTLYYNYLTQLFIEVKKLGLSCYIDSNGFFDSSKIQGLIDVTDKFLYDVKGVGSGLSELCFSNCSNDILISGKPNNGKPNNIEETHLINLKYLLSLNKIEEVRLVYLKGYYNEEEVIDSISSILKDYPLVPLKIIRVHTRGLKMEQVQELKGHIPTKLEVEKLVHLAYSKGIHQINHIL